MQKHKVDEYLMKDFLTTVPGLESLSDGTFHNGIVWDTAVSFSRKLSESSFVLSLMTLLLIAALKMRW